MDIVHFSLHFHWPGGAGRSTENGDRLSDSAITPMAMVKLFIIYKVAEVAQLLSQSNRGWSAFNRHIIATARVLPKATQRELFRLGAYPRYSQSHY